MPLESPQHTKWVRADSHACPCSLPPLACQSQRNEHIHLKSKKPTRCAKRQVVTDLVLQSPGVGGCYAASKANSPLPHLYFYEPVQSQHCAEACMICQCLISSFTLCSLGKVKLNSLQAPVAITSYTVIQLLDCFTIFN